jgi:hypothetical protein
MLSTSYRAFRIDIARGASAIWRSSEKHEEFAPDVTLKKNDL